MITIKQKVSYAGRIINEDCVWSDGKTLILLDGSTGLLPGYLDARWFTSCFLEGYQRSSEASLCDAVNSAIAYTREAFFSLTTVANPEYLPSAAGIFVREIEDMIEVLAIGDCTGILYLKNGVTVSVCDDSVKHKDNAVVERCIELRKETGINISDAVSIPEVREMLIANRKTMNRPIGYRILAPNMDKCSEDDVIRFPKKNILGFALISDGFEAMKERIGLERVSLNELYEKLRNEEVEDADCNIRPRLKMSDDATAVIAVISED